MNPDISPMLSSFSVDRPEGLSKKVGSAGLREREVGSNSSVRVKFTAPDSAACIHNTLNQYTITQFFLTKKDKDTKERIFKEYKGIFI